MRNGIGAASSGFGHSPGLPGTVVPGSTAVDSLLGSWWLVGKMLRVSGWSMGKDFIFVTLLLLTVSASMAQSFSELRMTPSEIRSSSLDDNQIGSSGLPGVHTKVLFGDPSKAGFYTVLLFVPAHTTIQAHSYRDDRIATVVSGGPGRGGSGMYLCAFRRRLGFGTGLALRSDKAWRAGRQTARVRYAAASEIGWSGS